MSWSMQASAAPDRDAFFAVSTAEPSRLPRRDVVDVIVAAEKLIGHLQAAQLTAIADFARPGRAAPVDNMLDMLHDRIGPPTGSNGPRDPAIVAAHLEQLGRDLAATEVAAALHQSHQGASARVALAVELVDEMPATLAAVSDGRIDIARARTIADRTRLLPPTDRHRVEAAVLPLAQTRTPGQLNPMIDRRVIAVDPAAAHKRTVNARRERFLDHRPAPDGMGDIQAHLPAEAALNVYDLLDQIAAATAGQDSRPATARRADALTDLCTALLTDGQVDITALLDPTASSVPRRDTARPAQHPSCGDAPSAMTTDLGEPDIPDAGTGFGVSDASARVGATSLVVDKAGTDRFPPRQPKIIGSRHGRPVHLNLTMTLDAFAGRSRDPAVLAGHGAITADLAAAIARSMASLSVQVIDTDGHTIAVGATTTYTPNRAITDHVLAAAGTCRFPSCRMPAYRCDIDHRIPFNHAHPGQGGQTTPDNLDPLCRRHHQLKTHIGWTARREATEGLTMTWTSPTGHNYRQDSATTSDRIPASEFFDCGGLPRPDDLDHVDDPPAPSPDDDHTCHTCSACAATGPSINLRTRDIIERQAAELVDRHHNRRRPNSCSPHATWTYRIGLENFEHRDDTDDDEDSYDIGQDVDYEPPTDAFLKRFCPEHYQHVQQQRCESEHHDADKAPF